MRCKNCRFYNELHEGLGECRRYAPHPFSSELRWEWPQIANPATSWCGEFEERYCSTSPEWPEDEQETDGYVLEGAGVVTWDYDDTG